MLGDTAVSMGKSGLKLSSMVDPTFTAADLARVEALQAKPEPRADGANGRGGHGYVGPRTRCSVLTASKQGAGFTPVV